MLSVLTIAGGVALLLFAVRFFRKGLDRLFGPRLGLWLQRVGERPGMSFFGGLGVAALMPSSTTISLMAVQSLQAGHMNARQMLAVMLGANIGLTILVQLVALELTEFAPVLILIGVILYQYTEQSRLRGVGQVLMSLGLIFLALMVIGSAVPTEIDPEGDLAKLIAIAENYPGTLALLAIMLAMAMQSSTASIGLVIGLVATGTVGIEVAVPVVFGANVGLSVTTLIIGWQQVEARRLGLANLLLKVIVAAIGLAALGPVLEAFQQMPGPATTRVAMVHTAFNVAVAIVGLPLIGMISGMMNQMIPEPRHDPSRTFGPRFIRQGPIGSTSMALSQSLREIMHVSEIVRRMLDDLWTALKEGDERLAQDVGRRDDQVDLLDEEIKNYLTRAIKEYADDQDTEEQLRQLRYLRELETMGDIIDKNLSQLVVKKIRLGAKFSEEGARELDEFKSRVAQNLLLADTAFSTRDKKLAKKVFKEKEELSELEQQLRDRHFHRLTSGLRESHETSAIHLDLLTHLKRLSSAAAHVAYAVLDGPRKMKIKGHGDVAE